MPATLLGITDRYIDYIADEHPVSATFLGLHSKDGSLGNMSAEAIAGRRERLGAMLSSLEGTPEAQPTREDAVDREILRIVLEGSIFSHDVLRGHELNPCEYVALALSGCNQLLLRDFAPLERRARNFVSRLEGIPEILTDCRRNVSEPPAVFAAIGAAYARGGLSFIDGTVPHICAEFPELESDLTVAASAAGEALEETRRWLTAASEASDAPFHIGREAYEWMLRRVHLLDLDSEELLEIGMRSLEDTRGAMEKIASDMGGERDWRDLVDDLRGRHPEACELRDFYADEMRRARDFVRRRGLVTMPAKEGLSVVDTPVFLRSLLPYAAYGPPGPFERRQQGFFYVTPVDADAPADEQDRQLRGHAKGSIRIIALHEGYPGHHVQLVRANSISNNTRKLARSNLFIEGWALYCEEMMRDEGFFGGPAMLLTQLAAVLWRAARVVVDVRLQRGEMTLNEAAGFMVEEAHLTRDKATAEVRRYAMNPTQPSSYLLGKRAILDIRRLYEDRVGDSFDLREFHDALLDLGSIPPALVKVAFGLDDGGAAGSANDLEEAS